MSSNTTSTASSAGVHNAITVTPPVTPRGSSSQQIQLSSVNEIKNLEHNVQSKVRALQKNLVILVSAVYRWSITSWKKYYRK